METPAYDAHVPLNTWLRLPRNVWSIIICHATYRNWAACMYGNDCWSWTVLMHVCRFMLHVPVIQGFRQLSRAVRVLADQLNSIGSTLWKPSADAPDAQQMSFLRMTLLKRVHGGDHIGAGFTSADNDHIVGTPMRLLPLPCIYVTCARWAVNFSYPGYFGVRRFNHVEIILYHPLVHDVIQLHDYWDGKCTQFVPSSTSVTDNVIDREWTTRILCNACTLWDLDAAEEERDALGVHRIYQYTRCARKSPFNLPREWHSPAFALSVTSMEPDAKRRRIDTDE